MLRFVTRSSGDVPWSSSTQILPPVKDPRVIAWLGLPIMFRMSRCRPIARVQHHRDGSPGPIGKAALQKVIESHAGVSVNGSL